MKSKIYELIGRAIVYSAIYVGAVGGLVLAFCQNTIY